MLTINGILSLTHDVFKSRLCHACVVKVWTKKCVVVISHSYYYKQANAELEKELSGKQRELEQTKQSLKNDSQNYTSLLKVVKLLKEKNGSLEDKVLALETDKVDFIF